MKSPTTLAIHTIMRTPVHLLSSKALFLQFGGINNGEFRSVPLNEAIETLGQYWPQLFPHGILRPMASDILAQFRDEIQARQLHLSDKKLRQCVTVILQSVAYQSTVMPGALCYSLSGQPQGLVSENALID